MYSTSDLQGVWHHIHGCLHQIYQCKIQFDQYVTTNIGVLFPYMVSLYDVVATGCNQSFYMSHQGGNLQLQSSCDQLWFSPVASLSKKLQLDFKTLGKKNLPKEGSLHVQVHQHCIVSVKNHSINLIKHVGEGIVIVIPKGDGILLDRSTALLGTRVLAKGQGASLRLVMTCRHC